MTLPSSANMCKSLWMADTLTINQKTRIWYSLCLKKLLFLLNTLLSNLVCMVYFFFRKEDNDSNPFLLLILLWWQLSTTYNLQRIVDFSQTLSYSVWTRGIDRKLIYNFPFGDRQRMITDAIWVWHESVAFLKDLAAGKCQRLFKGLAIAAI